MFETLNSYIDRPGDRLPSNRAPEEGSGRIGGKLNPFFPAIVTASIVSHLLFYAALVILNVWAVRSAAAHRVRIRGPEETVKMIDVPRLPDMPFGVRPRPEPVERADLSHLSLDPRLGDDRTLIARSPRPARPRVSSDKQEAPGPPGPVTAQTAPSSSHSTEPPATRPLQVSPPQAQPSSQIAGKLPDFQPEPAPSPGPTRRPSKEQPAHGGGQGETRQAEFGFRSAQSQYVAIVRDRIWKVNERIMPRDWIRDMLADRVSADFTILLGPGGRLLSSRLIRSCGYSTLDQKAREAIQLAAPFQGYPQEAGDRIEFTVTVYYTPLAH